MRLVWDAAAKRVTGVVTEQALAAGLDRVELGCGGVSVLDGLRTVNIADPVAYVRRSPDPAGIVATVEDLTLAGE